MRLKPHGSPPHRSLRNRGAQLKSPPRRVTREWPSPNIPVCPAGQARRAALNSHSGALRMTKYGVSCMCKHAANSAVAGPDDDKLMVEPVGHRSRCVEVDASGVETWGRRRREPRNEWQRCCCRSRTLVSGLSPERQVEALLA